MSNAGYEGVRARIAEMLTKRSGVRVETGHVVMAVGAAGGLNAVLKAILNPGDEVAVFAPYFKEYDFYAQNHGGKVVAVQTDAETFQPDAGALEKAVGPRTRALILNSPNNPSGAIYSADCYRSIAGALAACEKRFGTRVLVISDEPYSSIVYDGAELPNVLAHFENAVVVNSYSKSHALAGERIGFVAVGGAAERADDLANGIVFCTRVLGFVNAPAFLQRVVAESLEASVDIAYYEARREAACSVLAEAGFDFMKPQGAFYVFPRILGGDEEAFKERAVAHNILIVPGSGFAGPGRFRMAFCVGIDTIRNSRQAFLDLASEF
jgi:aspartate aminotransferase